MVERFNNEIIRLLGEDQSKLLILAVSGGMDSVVMAKLCASAKREFIIAHCNFQLRGEESDLDEEFVLQLGKHLGVSVKTKKFRTKEFATKRGISIQMAARQMRYEWFLNLTHENKAFIAMAHHGNDVAETLLFNLTKGTGIAGLHGIPDKDDNIIRPMLWATRAEIEDYAVKNNITWREDESNKSEKYMRGIIRHKVIPQLERVNPAFVHAAQRDAARFKQVENFMNFSIDQLGLKTVKNEHVYIDKVVLSKLPGRSAVLYYLLQEYRFNFDQIEAIILAFKSIGAIFNSDEWTLNIDRKHLILSAKKENNTEWLIASDDVMINFANHHLLISNVEANGYKIVEDANIGAFDLESLKFPLVVRNWRQGDYFTPLGMQGKKKVSDFLIDNKVPVNLKKDVRVLVSGEVIMWIIGQRISENFKVTESSRRIFEVKIEFNN